MSVSRIKNRTILIIIIVILLSAIFFKMQKNKPKEDFNLLNSSFPCSNFNAGFKILSLNYTNSQGKLIERTLSIWYPTEDPEMEFDYNIRTIGKVSPDGKISSCIKFPLIIFSHGYGGCGVQSLFITEELSRHGYIVAALDHNDAFCRSIPGEKSLLNKFDLIQFTQSQDWSDKSFIDRREDIEALIGFLTEQNNQNNSFFKNSINLDKIGISGHSLGGYTAFSIAGAWPSWKDERIKAALLFSPYVQAHVLKSDLKDVKIPIMIQGGKLEKRKNFEVKSAYDKLSGKKYLLMIKGAGHLAWSNIGCLKYSSSSSCLSSSNLAITIDYYSIAFFDKYLKNNSLADNRLKVKLGNLESYEYEIS